MYQSLESSDHLIHFFDVVLLRIIPWRYHYFDLSFCNLLPRSVINRREAVRELYGIKKTILAKSASFYAIWSRLKDFSEIHRLYLARFGSKRSKWSIHTVLLVLRHLVSESRGPKTRECTGSFSVDRILCPLRSLTLGFHV
jgi:hypothetical protein